MDATETPTRNKAQTQMESNLSHVKGAEKPLKIR